MRAGRSLDSREGTVGRNVDLKALLMRPQTLLEPGRKATLVTKWQGLGAELLCWSFEEDRACEP